MVRVLHNILTDFHWYRKWKGGTWYYNRWILDFGRTVIFTWDQYSLAPIGSGGSCALEVVTYE